MTNTLWFGDNLEVLRGEIADESVDLIYLDPPFNSNRSYNLLFKEKSGAASPAQLEAFEDTWSWDQAAEAAMDDMAMTAPADVIRMVNALRDILGDNDMMAYLAMMSQRLLQLHRVLKPTGSLYLHCDPTASHYLKIILDAIFGADRYQSEIIWQRTNARSTVGKWPAIHDSILFYGKQSPRFNPMKVPADKAKIPHTLVTGSDGKKYQSYELTAPGQTMNGESGRSWRGFDPGAMGRHWANAHLIMDGWDEHGLVHWPKNGGFPRRRDALPFDPDTRMTTVGDVWTDVDRINQSARERLGYPTQKPIALLERIINASSNPGDVVLDPFCGCGTAIAAAEKLGRQWIGIDVTYLAISVMQQRFRDHFPEPVQYEVKGIPSDSGGARKLFEISPFQFQWWAVDKLGINARPYGGKKKGADHGIDGEFFYSDERARPVRGLIQVKGGKTGSRDIRDFRGTMERETVDLGLFVCLQQPTRDMKADAAAAGFVDSGFTGRRHPRIQIMTIDELFDGRRPDVPHLQSAHQQAPRVKRKREEGRTLPMELDNRVQVPVEAD